MPQGFTQFVNMMTRQQFKSQTCLDQRDGTNQIRPGRGRGGGGGLQKADYAGKMCSNSILMLQDQKQKLAGHDYEGATYWPAERQYIAFADLNTQNARVYCHP